jgi:hypothetical protein
MFDVTRSVIIFSSPRSGSTWFQASLPQFNLGELFNLQCRILGWDIETGIRYKFSHTVDCIDIDKETEYRFELYRKFKDRHQTVSVKVHSVMLNDKTNEFLLNEQPQFVLLERRNKVNMFWSYLIAWNTMNWHGGVSAQQVYITRQSFDSAIQLIGNISVINHQLKLLYDMPHVFYEDVLAWKSSATWNPNNRFKIQNARAVTEFVNKEELAVWLLESAAKKILENI